VDLWMGLSSLGALHPVVKLGGRFVVQMRGTGLDVT
jgi:hypothetical protein